MQDSIKDGLNFAVSDSVWDDNSSSANEVTGMKEFLSTTSTLGGLAVADAANWKASIDATTSALTNAKMTDLWYTNAIRGNYPNIIVSRSSVVAKYERIQQGLLQWIDLKKPDGGVISAPTFKGVPFLADDDVPGSDGGTEDNYVCMLNTKFLPFKFHNQGKFRLKVYTEIPDSDTIVIRVFSMLALGCQLRQVQKAMTKIDPSL